MTILTADLITDKTLPTAAEVLQSQPLMYSELDQLSSSCGFRFFAHDVASGHQFSSNDQIIHFVPDAFAEQLRELDQPVTYCDEQGLLFYAVPFSRKASLTHVAVGYVPLWEQSNKILQPPADLLIAAAEQKWSQASVNEFWAQLCPSTPKQVERVLNLAINNVYQSDCSSRLERELDQVILQLDQTYEEISLLHDLTRNLQVSQTPQTLAELCLRRMHMLVGASGSCVVLRDGNDREIVLERGAIRMKRNEFNQLISCFQNSDWSHPLVKNKLSGTLLGSDFPGLENFILVPIREGMHQFGWVFACNRTQDRDFGTVEAGLMSSVATILGTHVRNTDLYQKNEDLLLGFVRTLISSLDAKDPYTRGHSERVGMIARHLGMQLGLSEKDLQDIYLSGLLHDVGKIGIDDRILSKPEKLTDEEFEEVKRHPMIGYHILCELENLTQVLPGVRNHHENWDGTGYPDHLVGEDIPLMARILAVADGYDAMGSDRPYRKGMPVEKIEEIFRKGSGRQWDPMVIDAYFACRDEIESFCANYSLEVGVPLSQMG
ncbi:HD domain-containing phosphohydrolase [Calycomorphotria hydatis]|uniref:Cyclic di-GMP phosphodiesterase response regulator RpfG n=1 Tax=Calycomorphotria hydatis TaxID=2528027 RepID=A0A517T763_9PLAN|nr:HD domain-containing phosphohydrolase [Calycomorphotria hydatis]QDT64216.1 Cyclic di-GMP phosphodiesterase response regulator RpfG [Calycomorphotria hydatis]